MCHEALDRYGVIGPLDVDKLAEERALSLTDQFVIRFQQGGGGNFNTSGDEDGIFLDDVLVEAPEVTYVKPPFSDGFESGELSKSWKAVNAYPMARTGLMEVVSSFSNIQAAHSGLFGVVMGRWFDDEFSANALDLHLDLSDHDQVELSFWIKDFHHETGDWDGVLFSDDGGESFRKAISLNTSALSDNVYHELIIDVDSLAAERLLSLTDRFIIRFQQGVHGDFNTSGDEDGIFLDDVLVTGSLSQGLSGGSNPSASSIRGDVDEDGEITSGDAILILRFVSELQTPTSQQANAADVDRDGEITSGDAILTLRFVAELIAAFPKPTNHIFLHKSDASIDGILADLDKTLYLNIPLPQSKIIAGGEFDIRYDPIYGVPTNVYVHGLPADAIVSINNSTPGDVKVSFAGLNPVFGMSQLTFQLAFDPTESWSQLEIHATGRLYNEVGIQVATPVVHQAFYNQPTEYRLYQNYPNPFNPETILSYEIPEAADISLRIYTPIGQLVRTLIEGRVEAGRHRIVWDGRDGAGQEVGTGLYLYRLDARGKGFYDIKRMVFVK